MSTSANVGAEEDARAGRFLDGETLARQDRFADEEIVRFVYGSVSPAASG
jgi:hypothetical protein